MLALASRSGARDTIYKQRNATATSATTSQPAVKRKVYGKRKVDAPRAVFDHKSPAKVVPETERDAVKEDDMDCIQSKLAEVKISQTPITNQVMGDTEYPCITDQEIHIIDAVSVPDPEPQVEQDSIQQPSTPILRKRYQRMVEVRITPRAVTERPRRQAKEPQNTSNGDKQRESTTRRNKPVKRMSSGCVSDDKANSYVRSILDEALSPIAAQGIQKFSSWAARAGTMLEVVKLAEGSYGEVYKLKLREDLCEKEVSKSKLARLKAYGDGVFKVVPLRAQSGPGSKKFTSIDEIVAEVKMLKYLDPVPGFARFREIHVVQGRFPESFQRAWDHYKKTKEDCFNPNPSSKRAYPDSQIWAILEMDDAGCELEKFSWSSIFQVYDIFWGVAMALARAEEYALFEHRDLHLGNVCIRSTRPNGAMDPPTDQEIMNRSYTSGFGLSTLETTLIDYSLSRAELLVDQSLLTMEVTSSDLDKKQIFDAVGQDEDEIMLRDTYRHMRAELYKGNPLETQKTPNIPGIWGEYAPRTNLIWLRFLLKSLLKNMKPAAPEIPPPIRHPLIPCSPNREMKRVAVQPAEKQSGAKVSIRSPEQQVSALKAILESRLNNVLDLLDLEHRHAEMCCAADLVAFAIDSQWLDEKDFF